MSGKKEPSISEQISELPSKGSSKFWVIFGFIALVILMAGVGSGIYFFIKYQSVKNLPSNTSKSASEATELVKKVGSLMVLPAGENPTIATVSDISKLKGQSFFAQAKNGDKVLIYQKAKKAILYDPTSNKIINVEVINIADADTKASQSAQQSTTPAAQLKAVILNGTKTPGLATTTEKSLGTTAKNLVVISKGNAKSNYTKTLVVDLTGKNASGASQVAALLKGAVGKLPPSEVKPTNGDILIILGEQ